MLREMDHALAFEFLIRAALTTRERAAGSRIRHAQTECAKRIVKVLKMQFPVGLNALVTLATGADHGGWIAPRHVSGRSPEPLGQWRRRIIEVHEQKSSPLLETHLQQAKAGMPEVVVLLDQRCCDQVAVPRVGPRVVRAG